MDKKEMEVGEKLTYEILDKIDIETICHANRCRKIGELMNVIEKDNGTEALLENEPIFGGYLFNFINVEDFIEYLKKRYGEGIKVFPVDDYWVGFAYKS